MNRLSPKMTFHKLILHITIKASMSENFIEAGKRGKASFAPRKKKGGSIFWRNAEGGGGGHKPF